MRTLVSLRPRILLDLAAFATAGAILKERSNFSIENVGEITLPSAVCAKIKSVYLRDALSSADAGISLISLNDRIYITLREQYSDESIASDFIKMLHRLGVSIALDGSARISEPKLKV